MPASCPSAPMLDRRPRVESTMFRAARRRIEDGLFNPGLLVMRSIRPCVSKRSVLSNGPALRALLGVRFAGLVLARRRRGLRATDIARLRCRDVPAGARARPERRLEQPPCRLRPADASHQHGRRSAIRQPPRSSESSPYLLQHAHNPVDWHPWGDEAFNKARELGRPVLLSVGYSTCHWCHVMEEASRGRRRRLQVAPRRVGPPNGRDASAKALFDCDRQSLL